MPGIGIGVGIGLGSGRARYGAQWLAAKVLAILPTGVVGLYIGDDIVDSSGTVTSWPGRVGGTLASIGSSSFVVGSIGGHKAIDQTVSSTACLSVANTDVLRTMVAVATTPPTVWPTYGTSPLLLSRNDILGFGLVVLNGGTSFYTGGGWSHYLDGTASEATIPSGNHIHEGTHSGISSTSLGTGFAGEATGWVGARSFLLASTEALSPGQRSALVSLLQSYYRLV